MAGDVAVIPPDTSHHGSANPNDSLRFVLFDLLKLIDTPDPQRNAAGELPEDMQW
jgi:quercetin dioxygenase-like cupin family protein